MKCESFGMFTVVVVLTKWLFCSQRSGSVHSFAKCPFFCNYNKLLSFSTQDLSHLCTFSSLDSSLHYAQSGCKSCTERWTSSRAFWYSCTSLLLHRLLHLLLTLVHNLCRVGHLMLFFVCFEHRLDRQPPCSHDFLLEISVQYGGRWDGPRRVQHKITLGT
jgi:hypothetical protein